MGLPVPRRGVTFPQLSEAKSVVIMPHRELQWRKRRGRAGSGPGRGARFTS